MVVAVRITVVVLVLISAFGANGNEVQTTKRGVAIIIARHTFCFSQQRNVLSVRRVPLSVNTAAITAAVVKHIAAAVGKHVRHTSVSTDATRRSHVFAATMMMITAVTIMKTRLHFQVCIIFLAYCHIFMCSWHNYNKKHYSFTHMQRLGRLLG